MSDRAIINLLGLLVHDRMAYMADGPERTALHEAWAAVLSAAEKPSNLTPTEDRQIQGRTDIKHVDRVEHWPAPVPDQMKKAWEEAEATGLGWPGTFFGKKGDEAG